MQQAPVTIYTPESQLRSPLRLARSMWHDLLASRELAWRLMVRDISSRYRQSVLGVLWAFLPPVVTAGLFILLNRSAIIGIGETKIPYPAFVFFGTVLWQLFTDSLNAPLKAVTANKSTLAKINLPREAFILSAVGQVLFDFGVRLVILVPVFVMFHIPLTWGLLVGFPATLMLMLFGIMVGLMLTPIGVLYSDVAQGLATFTTLWFFLTPVVYPPPQQGILATLVSLNPVTALIVGARDLVTTGVLSDGLSFTVVSCLTVVGLSVMWVVYRVSLPILIERIGA